MMRYPDDIVRWIPGVPKWFALLLHYKNRRACRRRGYHTGDYICTYCGKLLQGRSNAEVDAVYAKWEAGLHWDIR